MWQARANHEIDLDDNRNFREMQERKRFKGDESQTGKQSYLKLKQEIQRMRRKPKDDYYNEKCKKIEELYKRHNPLRQ